MEENEINSEAIANETQDTVIPSEKQYNVTIAGNALKGKLCPFCKTDINEGEEVIVCSACNTPHHKNCWEENKGCTTFGCSEQHYEAQGTNPTDVCPNCGATLGDGQTFCPKCGTPKGGAKKNICGKCGAELQDGQEFCPKCGQKAELQIDTNVNSAISQFNSGLEKKKKKSKVLPIILAIVLVIVAIGGYFTYNIIQEKNLAVSVDEYKENASSFHAAVLSSGATMEDIGNEIRSAWYAYVHSSRYNGSRYYSVDSAISAAQSYKSSDISSVVSSNSSIGSLYKSLLTVPDTNDQELLEIKDTVKDVYEAYNDMYDCVISPTGNYSSWTSEFSDADSELADAIGDLSNLLN